MSPTPYPEVNILLQELLDGVLPILGKHLIGMYLFGSLALGDFDEASDIDVAIVTNEPVTDEQFLALKKMHAHIARGPSPLAIQIEASYLSLAQLRRYDPTNAMHPQLQRDAGVELEMQNHARVVERYVLREKGVVVKGPPLEPLIAPITPDDLRSSAQEILNDWMIPLLQAAEPFASRGYQSYTVLSLARILYTFRFGDVVSKPVAARWAQETLDDRWKQLIERALVGRKNSALPPEADDVQETLNFARLVLQIVS
jgi:Aminoglycoside adenylyltransferase, C-terminal domain/Nucleotidyltransferase domain